MRVLVVGGFGYLGSVITDIIKNDVKKSYVDVIDNCLFGNEFVQSLISFNNLNPELDVDIESYDCVIWSANLDTPQLYESEKLKEFLDINKKEFKDLLRRSKKFINLSHFLLSYNIKDQDVDTAMIQYFRELEDLVNKSNTATNIRIPVLHGPSPRMRWDTLANELMFNFIVTKKIMLEGGWLIELPLCNVFDMAKYIVELSQLDVSILVNTYKQVEYCTEKYSLIELAHMLTLNDSDSEVKVLEEAKSMDLAGFSNISSGTKSFTDSYKDIVRNIEKGDNADFANDSYNNENVINAALSSIHFVKKLGM